MADIENVKKGIYEMLIRCSWDDIDKERHRFQPVLNDVLELLEKQQTEIERLKEQQPKKGKWQPYKYGDDTWHQCSACGIADRYISIVKRDGHPDYRMVSKRNFCPICGADMRGEQK